MPTMVSNKPEYKEVGIPVESLAFGVGTGKVVFANSEWFEASDGGLSCTGLYRCGRHEALQLEPMRFGIPDSSPADTKERDVPIVLVVKSFDQVSTVALDTGYGIMPTRFPEPPHHQEVAEFTTSAIVHLPLIASTINSKLRERLSQFWDKSLDLEPVAPSTKSDLENLAAWLSSQSKTVSAVVSNHGMLSIATVFPNDVRLYVEIERDGSVEAAVTRERRFAIDISVTSISDLTPEVILAVVGTI